MFLTFLCSKLNQRIINEFLKKKINNLTIEESSLIGHYLSSDIIDETTGKIFYEAGFEIDEDFNQETEEELLDIPTFLRRQAN